MINKTPTPILSNKSPYQLLLYSLPSHDYLCVCYATSTFLKHKFNSRAHKCIFLDYPYGVKCYKLLDLQSHRTFILCDVVLYESIFHFQYNSNLYPSPHNTNSIVIPLSFLENISTSSPPSNSTSNIVSKPSSHDPDASIPPIVPILHQSTRIRQTFTYLQQYYCDLPFHSQTCTASSLHATSTKIGTSSPLFVVLSYDQLYLAHHAFTIYAISSFVPKFYRQAIKYPHWKEVMSSKIISLKTNKT